MPLTPEADHALYANNGIPLEAQLEAALARNVAGGLAVAETTSLASVAAGVLAEVGKTTLISKSMESLSIGFIETLENVLSYEAANFAVIGHGQFCDFQSTRFYGLPNFICIIFAFGSFL